MKYDTEEFRHIAEPNTILRCQVGSGAHGLAIEGYDDRDEMGMCIEPPEYVIGLKRFDQYQYRTKPEGVRSEAGDLDLVIYSLRKWMRLALAGNPSILIPLFVPQHDVVGIMPAGAWLRQHPERVVSRRAGYRFAGYLRRQRLSLLSREGKGRDVTRPELIEKYGFDTKYAAHMVRLGIQGIELLTTGSISLPMKPYWREYIRDLRQGKHTQEDALSLAREAEDYLNHLVENSTVLPERSDYEWASRWLTQTYIAHWGKI